jgi:hypothetical protein
MIPGYFIAPIPGKNAFIPDKGVQLGMDTKTIS